MSQPGQVSTPVEVIEGIVVADCSQYHIRDGDALDEARTVLSLAGVSTLS
jgi:hypothetical protein